MKIIYVKNISFCGVILLLLIELTLTKSCCKRITASTPTSVVGCRCGECSCEWTRLVLKTLSDILEIGLQTQLVANDATHHHDYMVSWPQTRPWNFLQLKLRYGTYNNLIVIRNGFVMSINGCALNSTTSAFQIEGYIPVLTATGEYRLSVGYFNEEGSYNHTLYGNKFVISFVCTTETNFGNDVSRLRIHHTKYASTTTRMKMTMKNSFLDTLGSAYTYGGLKYTIEHMMSDIIKNQIQMKFNNQSFL